MMVFQPKLLDEKQTTIYKRAVDKNYHLKMKSSRFIFSDISQKFPIMPFSARYVNISFYALWILTSKHLFPVIIYILAAIKIYIPEN